MSEHGLGMARPLRLRLLRVALGREPADLVIANCRAVNVYTGEVERTNIHIVGDRIACLDANRSNGRVVFDAAGLLAIPGLMDAHMHIEATSLTPARLAEVVVPRGVTCLFADLHEMAGVAGLPGLEAMRANARPAPLRLFLQAPSVLPPAALRQMLDWPETISLGETGLSRIGLDEIAYLDAADATTRRGLRLSGHAAGLGGRQLSALAAVGQHDDHEAHDAADAVERLRRGMKVMAREGSAARDLQTLLPALRQRPELARHLMFCTDDKDADTILSEGHIDYNLRLALREGIDLGTAVQMATLNCAEHYHLAGHLGALAPGRLADIVLLDDPAAPLPARVMVGGGWVAEEGRPLWQSGAFEWPAPVVDSMRLSRPLGADDFNLARGGRRARLIRVFGDRIVKELQEVELSPAGESVVSNVSEDVLKVAVIERHRASGNIGIALVRGFGLRRGALASSVAHDEHNIVVAGVDERDMAGAANAVAAMGGGFAVVAGGRVAAALPLPLAGLMSDEAPADVAAGLRQVRAAAQALGCPLPAPFITLSFVPLAGLPEAGVSEYGLLDAATRQPMDLFIQ